MLNVREVDAGYGRKQVLAAVSVNVGPGEIVALIGPNGSGKSTLLKAACGLIPCWAGDIEFRGHSILGRTPAENALNGITLAPQGSRVFGELTVRENLEIGGFLLRKDRCKRRIEIVLDLFPAVRNRQGELASRLSGGEQQMLALARALLPEPRVLMLDEPSLGLGPALVRKALRKISEVSEMTGASVLIVEQKVHEVLSIAHRVYGLKLGRTIFEAVPADLNDGKALRELFL